MKELEEKLLLLKGVLLLNSKGEIYILKDYRTKVRTNTVGNWFSKQKVDVEYIDRIECTYTTHSFGYDVKQRHAIQQVNTMIGDRRRYAVLQHTLRKVGCAIVTRRFREERKHNDVNQINKTQSELSGEDSSN